MGQVLDFQKPEEIIIIIPEIDIKIEKVPVKEQKKSRFIKLRKPAKYHEELNCINKLKSKLNANLYRHKLNVF
ncbi:MAG: hypothetical protein ACFE9Q_00180 [Candidatus Hodarchaeota archaeon]